MPLSFTCPACEKALTAPFAAAGLSGTCKFCKARIIAPHQAGQPARLASEPASSAGAAAGAAEPPPPGPDPLGAQPSGFAPPGAPPPQRDVLSDPKVAKAFMSSGTPAVSDFWKRTLGFAIDMVLLTGILMSVGVLLRGAGASVSTNVWAVPKDEMGKAMQYMLAMFTVKVLYFGLFEGSPLQATPGKLVLGMKVCTTMGERVSLFRALWRGFCKWFVVGAVGFVPVIGIFPYAIFLYAMQDRLTQTLHDMMADTVVAERAY